MSSAASTAVWQLPLPSSDKFIALALADHADPVGGHIFPSVGRVARMCGCSERTVQRALRRLERLGLLRRTVRATPRLATQYEFTEAVMGVRGDKLSSPEEIQGRQSRHSGGDKLSPEPKTLEPKASVSSFLSETSSPQETQNGNGQPLPPRVFPAKEQTGKTLIAAHRARFVERFGSPPAYAFSQDVKRAAVLVRTYGSETALGLVRAFFDSTRGWWVEKQAYGFNVFSSAKVITELLPTLSHGKAGPHGQTSPRFGPILNEGRPGRGGAVAGI